MELQTSSGLELLLDQGTLVMPLATIPQAEDH